MERSELVKQPDGTTENPYSFDAEWQDKSKSGIGKAQFFYDPQYEANQQNRRQDNRKRKRDNFQSDDPGDGHHRRHQDEQQPSIKCWFCLASPDVEKHLIASIGDFCYLALPKGGLVPEHCMVVPIDHFRFEKVLQKLWTNSFMFQIIAGLCRQTRSSPRSRKI